MEVEQVDKILQPSTLDLDVTVPTDVTAPNDVSTTDVNPEQIKIVEPKEEPLNELQQIIKKIVKLHDDKAIYKEFLEKYQLKIHDKQFDTAILVIGTLNNNVNSEKFKELIDTILLVIKDKKIEFIEIPSLILKITEILSQTDLHKFSKNDVITFIKILFLLLIDLSIIEMNQQDTNTILKLLDLSLNLLLTKLTTKHKWNRFNCFKSKK